MNGNAGKLPKLVRNANKTNIVLVCTHETDAILRIS